MLKSVYTDLVKLRYKGYYERRRFSAVFGAQFYFRYHRSQDRKGSMVLELLQFWRSVYYGLEMMKFLFFIMCFFFFKFFFHRVQFGMQSYRCKVRELKISIQFFI